MAAADAVGSEAWVGLAMVEVRVAGVGRVMVAEEAAAAAAAAVASGGLAVG